VTGGFCQAGRELRLFGNMPLDVQYINILIISILIGALMARSPSSSPALRRAEVVALAGSSRGAKNPVPPVHRHAAHLARRFQQICLGVTAEVLEPESLTPLQYAVIGSVDDAPGLDQRRLAARIGIDPVSAHHLVSGLEAAGLLERRTEAEDRRARVLHLTRRGSELRRRLRPAMMASQDRILAPLSPGERMAFMALLTRIVEGNEVYARPGNGRRRPTRKNARPE
jgi:MarR family transcriptional regulator, temperature-dependent positive regulator of motility